MTDEEHRARVLDIARDIARTLRAHTDSLPALPGAELAYMGVCVALGMETLRIMRMRGVEPDVDDLARALEAMPFDSVAALAIEQEADLQ